MTDSADGRSPGARRTWRILVIDDDELSGAVQSQLLQLLGFEASTEIDGERAIARAIGEHFDLMLVDLSMPRVNGFEVLTRLRALEAEQGRDPMPLIAVTGLVAPEDRQRCLDAGFVDHVKKPVQLAKRQSTIESVLGDRRPPGGAPSPAFGTDADRLRATVRRLGEMTHAEGRFAPTVAEAFALRSGQLIELLHRTIDDRDRLQSIHHAQALEASALLLGASQLASSAAAIASDCRDGDWPQARQRLLEFEHQHQAVLTVLFQIDR